MTEAFTISVTQGAIQEDMNHTALVLRMPNLPEDDQNNMIEQMNTLRRTAASLLYPVLLMDQAARKATGNESGLETLKTLYEGSDRITPPTQP